MTKDLKIWKFTPVARPDDARWLGHRPVRALYVAAESPAMARVIAARADVPPSQGKVGNESGHSHSRFGDEKLYRVDAASEEDLQHLPGVPARASVIGERREDGTIGPWGATPT